MKVIVFDIWADYGHFKTAYTTTSPISYPIPPKTSVYGMLGTIIGLDKNKYLNHFQDDNCQIAIKINKPIQKTHISENLLNTKVVTKKNYFARWNEGTSPRTQIKIEFLKDASYRLYVSLQDEQLFKKLVEQGDIIEPKVGFYKLGGLP